MPKTNYTVKKISCAKCGIRKNLILLPITIEDSMFGFIYSCPKCFALLRKAEIVVTEQGKVEKKKSES